VIGQKLRLDLEDGREVVVDYDLRDVRAWESEHGKSALTEETSYDQLAWLGHHAAVRTGAINGDLSTFEAFAGRCVSVEGLRREAPGPTRPAKGRKGSPKSRGADSSAPSPSEPASP
jgi:hypothetical protein